MPIMKVRFANTIWIGTIFVVDLLLLMICRCQMVTVCTGHGVVVDSICLSDCIHCWLVLELTKLGSMFDSVVTKGEFSEPRDLRLLRMMVGAAAGSAARVLAVDHSPRHRPRRRRPPMSRPVQCSATAQPSGCMSACSL